MLNIVGEMYGDLLTLLQHDGFTASKRLDTARIEAEIEHQTGFRMVLEEERLEPIKT